MPTALAPAIAFEYGGDREFVPDRAATLRGLRRHCRSAQRTPLEPQDPDHGELTKGPIGIGTTFRAKWTKSPLVELRITQWDRPRGWAYVNGGAIAVDLTITLEELDNGRATLLRSRFDATPHGLVRLIFPLLLASLRREEANNMKFAKSYVENDTPSGS